MSGFFFFANQNRSKVMKEQPTLKITEVAKLNGEHWAKLTEEERAPFNKLNAEDIARHEKETKQLNELGYFINSDGVKSTLLSKKGKVLDFVEGTVMPKKTATSYMCFFKSYHAENKDTTAHVVASETAKVISQQWNALSPDQKEKYEALSRQDRERHDDQINQLKKNGYFVTEDGTKSTDLPQKTKRVKK